MTTQLIRSTIKMMADANVDVVDMKWFDLTGAFKNDQRVNLEPLMTHRPPFEKCMVVWQGATRNHKLYEVLMMTAGTDAEEGIVVAMWKGPVGTRLQTMPSMVYLIEGDQVRYGGVNDEAAVEKEVAELMLSQVSAWYAAMDQRLPVHIPQVKDSYTNRRKIMENKTPTYDWTTVYIEPAQPRAEHKGGTHATPRQHDRRGHLRRLQTGKNVWVKACKVGDASKGTVWHDYVMKDAECAN